MERVLELTSHMLFGTMFDLYDYDREDREVLGKAFKLANDITSSAMEGIEHINTEEGILKYYSNIQKELESNKVFIPKRIIALFETTKMRLSDHVYNNGTKIILKKFKKGLSFMMKDGNINIYQIRMKILHSGKEVQATAEYSKGILTISATLELFSGEV